jgi:predicted anti-sigma-YlaC factor YlaD
MNESCKTIRPLLVDYSDGVLPVDQVATVAAHLADCAACRAELRLLEDSLSLAREVWQEAAATSPRPLGEGPGVRAGESNKRPFRQKVALAGGLAVCAAIVLVAIGLSLFRTGKSPSTAQRPASPPKSEAADRADTAAPKENAVATDVDAMEYIAREGRAARLAASMQMLAAEPNLKAYKDNAERYLRENYADTTAVKLLGQQ